jgi:hypothetical protein
VLSGVGFDVRNGDKDREEAADPELVLAMSYYPADRGKDEFAAPERGWASTASSGPNAGRPFSPARQPRSPCGVGWKILYTPLRRRTSTPRTPPRRAHHAGPGQVATMT